MTNPLTHDSTGQSHGILTHDSTGQSHGVSLTKAPAPPTTEENPWKETVRGIFDMLVLSTEQASDLECRILDLIESRHHDYFCEGKTMAEWNALKRKNAPNPPTLDLAEELIVSRLKRYAARTARHPTQAGLFKADKAISIIRERFSFVRKGRPLQRERGKGERAKLQK